MIVSACCSTTILAHQCCFIQSRLSSCRLLHIYQNILEIWTPLFHIIFYSSPWNHQFDAFSYQIPFELSNDDYISIGFIWRRSGSCKIVCFFSSWPLKFYRSHTLYQLDATANDLWLKFMSCWPSSFSILISTQSMNSFEFETINDFPCHKWTLIHFSSIYLKLTCSYFCFYWHLNSCSHFFFRTNPFLNLKTSS